MSDDVYALGHYFNEAMRAEGLTTETVWRRSVVLLDPLHHIRLNRGRSAVMAAVSLNPLRVAACLRCCDHLLDVVHVLTASSAARAP